MDKKITYIPITRPGKDVNVNGIFFEPESYKKVMESERIKEVFKTNIGLPLTLNSNYFKQKYVPIEDWIGKVVGWTEDHIKVETTEDKYNLYIKPFENTSKIKAGILGFGEFVGSQDKNVNTFAIKNIIEFQLLTGIAAKNRKTV